SNRALRSGGHYVGGTGSAHHWGLARPPRASARYIRGQARSGVPCTPSRHLAKAESRGAQRLSPKRASLMQMEFYWASFVRPDAAPTTSQWEKRNAGITLHFRRRKWRYTAGRKRFCGRPLHAEFLVLQGRNPVAEEDGWRQQDQSELRG